ncbi:hypothetical protein [Streptomyces sp. GESEQ-35]|nr:hypothetical protein [Streptomyces sp. GESEQ-35]
MTPVPKPRAITSVAGAIPVQRSVSVAIREDQTSGLALRRWVSANARGA